MMDWSLGLKHWIGKSDGGSQRRPLRLQSRGLGLKLEDYGKGVACRGTRSEEDDRTNEA